ncbi:MAG: glycosyltransferase family 39 protein, partial [Acidobacteriota bacterium]
QDLVRQHIEFLLRLALTGTQSVINFDGTYYATLGRKLIAGDISGGISAYWSPLYPFLTGIASLFTSDLEFAGRLVSVLAGSLLIIPGYILIREFYGSAAAVLGTIVLVIHPSLLVSSVWVMTEATYIVIFTSMVVCGWRAVSAGEPKYYFATGLFLGLAYLTKPESIAFVGLFLVLAVGMKFLLPGIALRSVVMGGVLLAFGFSIFFLPYFIHLHQKTGHWTISQKISRNVPSMGAEKGFLRLTDDGSTTMRDRLINDVYDTEQLARKPAAVEQTATTPKTWSSRISELVSRSLGNLILQAREHEPLILPRSFLLFVILGFVCAPRNVTSVAREIYLLAIVACTILGYAATVVEARYSFALIPIVFGWTSRGILDFVRLVKQFWPRFDQADKRLREKVLAGTILLLLIFFLVPLFPELFELGNISSTRLEEKQAGLWIKEHGKADRPVTVMSSSPIVAFYAGANHIHVPDEEFPTVLEYAKRKNVEYLVFGQGLLRDTPNAFPKDENGTPGLSLVYKDEHDPDLRVLIWELSEE